MTRAYESLNGPMVGPDGKPDANMSVAFQQEGFLAHQFHNYSGFGNYLNGGDFYEFNFV